MIVPPPITFVKLVCLAMSESNQYKIYHLRAGGVDGVPPIPNTAPEFFGTTSLFKIAIKVSS